MATSFTRRLPGFRFEVQSPLLRETLPRMDVVVFVGFAASGPLHTPVAVDDVAQFTAIFGVDATLVWDEQQGTPVTAYLAPAVRSFFRNGGRRCWVVRVAGDEAHANIFPIPGLAMAAFDAQGRVAMTPAFAQARSEGSWSDVLRVSATLLARPIAVTQLQSGGLGAELAPQARRDIAPGDLLRVTLRQEGYILLLAVQEVDPVGAVRVTGSRALWFSTRFPAGAAAAPAWAYVYNQAGGHPDSPVAVLDPPDWSTIQTDSAITLRFELPSDAMPAPGSLVRIEVGEEELWLIVKDVGVSGPHGSPPATIVQLTGQGLWLMQVPPQPLPEAIASGEVLTFDLWVRQGADEAVRLRDLGFTADHARFWAALPTDRAMYTDMAVPHQTGRAELAFDHERRELWRSSSEKRFPLAGYGPDAALYVPIGMSLAPEYFLGPLGATATPLERDGLSRFDARLFIDPHLIDAGTATLMARADFLRYQSPTPHQLKGIHVALEIEEATIIAVPDAVHRGWVSSVAAPPLVAEPSSPPPRPEWWHFLACSPAPEIPLVRAPEWGNFLNCDIRIIPAPELSLSAAPDQSGTFMLSWSLVLAGATYILEEATRPNFSDAQNISVGPQDSLTIYGRRPGEYYYRVRATVGGATSDWSNGVGVRVATAEGWRLQPITTYSATTLLAVQRALLRLCAARGDLLTVLSLPEHYREDEALAHVETLKSTTAAAILVGDAVLRPLGGEEVAAYSYASLYHPWLVSRDDILLNSLRSIPPEGAACGVLAARALARGAWIAPANEALRDVVALKPPMARQRRLAIQEAQINLIRQEPRGFVALSADTLSVDVDLRPINVRRLLILLRRLALRLGATYVFEPNDDAFRRLVQRGFEAMLDDMFVRGAFAGATPATSFQVVTSNALNTPQSVDQGRFIVELKVAPSLPITFLTIRLLQSGDRTLVTEGR
jgi:hypothetical protein